jgi:CHAT domain-containing protein
LVVAASPAGLSALDLKGEQEGIEAARQVRVKVLAGAGPEELREELQRGGYQVIHFMGHGTSDAAEGSLIFSTPDGEPRKVTGNELSHLVQGAPALGLTLLNACHSAAVPTGLGAAALAGVAGALVRGGLPAVVGMQLAISDRAALTFSKVLYARLAEGEPIEAAVSEARLALFLADSGGRDWVAPVLFLRGSNQRIEGETMKEKPPEKDVNRVLYNSDEIEGEELAITGELLAGGLQDDSDRRARDSRTEVNAKQTKVTKLTIIGSDQRNSK